MYFSGFSSTAFQQNIWTQKKWKILKETMLKNWGIQMCKTVVAESPAQLLPLLFWGSSWLCCGAATSLITCYHHTELFSVLNLKFVPLVNSLHKCKYSKTCDPLTNLSETGPLKHPYLVIYCLQTGNIQNKIWKRQHILVLFLNTDMKNWVN